MLVVLVVLVAVVLLGLVAAVDSRLRGNDGLGAVKRRSASQAEAQAQAKKTKMPATSSHAGCEPFSGCRAHECWLQWLRWFCLVCLPLWIPACAAMTALKGALGEGGGGSAAPCGNDGVG